MPIERYFRDSEIAAEDSATIQFVRKVPYKIQYMRA